MRCIVSFVCHRRAGENLGIRQGYSMGKNELLHVLHIWQCVLHSLPLSLSSLRSDSRYSKFITFTVHLYHHCHPQKSCSPSQAHSVVGHVIDHEPPCYLPSLWRSQGTEDLALDMLYNRVWGHLDVNFQLLFFVSEETLKYEPSPLFIDFWAPPPKDMNKSPSSLQLQNYYYHFLLKEWRAKFLPLCHSWGHVTVMWPLPAVPPWLPGDCIFVTGVQCTHSLNKPTSRIHTEGLLYELPVANNYFGKVRMVNGLPFS